MPHSHDAYYRQNSSDDGDVDNKDFDLPRRTHLNKLLNKAQKLLHHGLVGAPMQQNKGDMSISAKLL